MGDISLEQFLNHFKTLNLEVSMISCGVSILYRCTSSSLRPQTAVVALRPQTAVA
jgi:hypothetical protein